MLVQGPHFENHFSKVKCFCQLQGQRDAKDLLSIFNHHMIATLKAMIPVYFKGAINDWKKKNQPKNQTTKTFTYYITQVITLCVASLLGLLIHSPPTGSRSCWGQLCPQLPFSLFPFYWKFHILQAYSVTAIPKRPYQYPNTVPNGCPLSPVYQQTVVLHIQCQYFTTYILKLWSLISTTFLCVSNLPSPPKVTNGFLPSKCSDLCWVLLLTSLTTSDTVHQ